MKEDDERKERRKGGLTEGRQARKKGEGRNQVGGRKEGQ